MKRCFAIRHTPGPSASDAVSAFRLTHGRPREERREVAVVEFGERAQGVEVGGERHVVPRYAGRMHIPLPVVTPTLVVIPAQVGIQ